MTLALSFFFNYYLYVIIDQLHIYAYSLFIAQPLLFFIIASMLFIPSEIILPYFDISCQYIDITLNYLYRTIFQLNTNVGYIVRLEDRDIIFDFSPHYESEDLEEESENEIARIAQQDIARLTRLSNIQQQNTTTLDYSGSLSQLFPSDEEIEDIEITSTDYDCVDDDINYDLD